MNIGVDCSPDTENILYVGLLLEKGQKGDTTGAYPGVVGFST